MTAPSASGGSLVTLGTTRMATVMATSYRQCAYKSAHARNGERTHGRQQGRSPDPAAPAGAGSRAGYGWPAAPDAGPRQAFGWPVLAQSGPCTGRTRRGEGLGRALPRLGAYRRAGPAGRAQPKGRAAGRSGERAARPQGRRGPGRQLGAGQSAVVAERLADQAPPLRRGPGRALALWHAAQGGPTRRG